METTRIEAGSDALRVLATITTRNDGGLHFTENPEFPDELVEALEEAGLIVIGRPVHGAEGVPYSRMYWTVEVTGEGVDLVQELYDERDYD